MQLINYFSTPTDTCGRKAIVPRLGQSKVTVPVGSGTTAANLFTALTTGAVPYDAGQIRNASCVDIQVTANYLGTDDCNACTVTAATLTPLVFVVPAGSVFPLPPGLIASATFVTGTRDAAGVFTAANVAKDAVIEWVSAYQPCCEGVTLVP